MSSAWVIPAVPPFLMRSDDRCTTRRLVALPPAPTDRDRRQTATVDPLDHTVLYAADANRALASLSCVPKVPRHGLYVTNDRGGETVYNTFSVGIAAARHGAGDVSHG